MTSTQSPILLTVVILTGLIDNRIAEADSPFLKLPIAGKGIFSDNGRWLLVGESYLFDLSAKDITASHVQLPIPKHEYKPERGTRRNYLQPQFVQFVGDRWLAIKLASPGNSVFVVDLQHPLRSPAKLEHARVRKIAVSSELQKIFSACGKEIRIWDLRAGPSAAKPQIVETNQIPHIVSSDGRWGTMSSQILDLLATPIKPRPAGKPWPLGMESWYSPEALARFSPDGKLLFTPKPDGAEVAILSEKDSDHKVVELASTKLKYDDLTVIGSETPGSFAFAPNSRWLVYCTQGGGMQLWDLTVRPFRAQGVTLIAGDPPPTVTYDIGPRKPVWFDMASKYLFTTVYNRSGLPNRRQQVIRYDLKAKDIPASRKIIGGVGDGPMASPDGRWVVSDVPSRPAAGHRPLQVFNVETQKLKSPTEGRIQGRFLRVEFSVDSRWLIGSQFAKPGFSIWDLKSPTLSHQELAGPEGHRGPVIGNWGAKSKDGRWRLTSCTDRAILWDMSKLSQGGP